MSGTLHKKNSMTLRLSVKFFFFFSESPSNTIDAKTGFTTKNRKKNKTLSKNRVKGFSMQISDEWNSIIEIPTKTKRI
jgi:hypothetical protein